MVIRSLYILSISEFSAFKRQSEDCNLLFKPIASQIEYSIKAVKNGLCKLYQDGPEFGKVPAPIQGALARMTECNVRSWPSCNVQVHRKSRE